MDEGLVLLHGWLLAVADADVCILRCLGDEAVDEGSRGVGVLHCEHLASSPLQPWHGGWAFGVPRVVVRCF